MGWGRGKLKKVILPYVWNLGERRFQKTEQQIIKLSHMKDTIKTEQKKFLIINLRIWNKHQKPK